MNQPIHPDFEHLVDSFGEEIFAYLWRLFSGSQQDAEDCLQETFLKAFQSYERLRPNSNYRAWLYKIATNTGLTMLKRARPMDQLNEEKGFIGVALSTESMAEKNILLEKVAKAVDTLPPKQRSAIFLRKYQSLSYSEIAGILGGDEASVRANVYQGVRKLRKLFNPEQGGSR